MREPVARRAREDPRIDPDVSEDDCPPPPTKWEIVLVRCEVCRRRSLAGGNLRADLLGELRASQPGYLVIGKAMPWRRTRRSWEGDGHREIHPVGADWQAPDSIRWECRRGHRLRWDDAVVAAQLRREWNHFQSGDERLRNSPQRAQVYLPAQGS